MDMGRRVNRNCILVALACLAAVVSTATADASTLDPSFGAGGVVTPVLPREAAIHAAGIVDLGAGEGTKVLGALKGLGSSGFFGAVELDGAEVPDPSFGGDGYSAPFSLPWTGVNLGAQAEAVAAQPDGKVVVAGYSQEGVRSANSFAPLIARYSVDGSLDPSFAAGGIVATRPNGTGGTKYHDVAVEPDGTILAAGGRNESSLGAGAPAGVLAAYRPDGTVDTAFGSGGRTVFKGKKRRYTTLRAIDLLPSGKILVAGFLNYRLFLARLNPDGRLDSRFGGGDGQVTLDLHANVCCQTAGLVAAGDGHIVVAAMGGSTQKRRVYLARYLASGGRDRSFGTDGVEASRPTRHLTVFNGVAVEADGTIVTVGRGPLRHSEPGAFAVFRNSPSGGPDRSFGREGLEVLSTGDESSAGAALSTTAGTVVGGSFASTMGDAGTQTTLLLARLSGSG